MAPPPPSCSALSLAPGSLRPTATRGSKCKSDLVRPLPPIALGSKLNSHWAPGGLPPSLSHPPSGSVALQPTGQHGRHAPQVCAHSTACLPCDFVSPLPHWLTGGGRTYLIGGSKDERVEIRKCRGHRWARGWHSRCVHCCRGFSPCCPDPSSPIGLFSWS